MSQEQSQSSVDKEPFLVMVIICLQETKVIQVQPSALGRKALAPKITKESLQKAFDFDFESLDSSLYEFWKCSNVMFKWWVDGRVERLGMSIETKEEYNSMKQGIESHCTTIVHIKVKDTDLVVFRVSSNINVDMTEYAMALQDLTPLKAAQAKHTVALKAQWKCSLHLGDWCYRHHMDDYCIHLNVAAFGIWARAIYKDTALVENPLNVKYFNLASHCHQNTQSEQAESASGSIATLQFLELLTAVIKRDTPHMTMALPMPPVTPKQPDTQPPVRHNQNASEHL
ncbi:hypothetical protein BS47DRAFT_1366277 [Hydnum rufescens UP504]|uniref:Uncharacterized protein n=1 Tax=Hydnum rufescens UP504 TaxID=1448309 RepID=A0A9P6ALY5_9AGAM|nr:hypothetical protein BS47DRAFT_1366277 [Hydnum rufescens UP504]